MPADALSFSTPVHQRAQGVLRLSFKGRDGGAVLDGLRQEGCLKARLPRPERGAWPGAVLLNSAGGVAGGDVLDTAIRVEGGGCTVATQAAERFYRAIPGTPPARVRTALHVGPGAALDWLPQESILFQDAALDRALRIDIAAGARLVCVESLVFGRMAMGEEVRSLRLQDRIVLRVAGRLVLHEATRIDGDAAALLDRPACAAGGRAVAALLAVGCGADRLDAVRDALAGHDAGACLLEDGVLVARIVAKTGGCLRRAVVAGLAALRDGRPLPRVWSV
jgi:urease accessory protein